MFVCLVEYVIGHWFLENFLLNIRISHKKRHSVYNKVSRHGAYDKLECV